MVPRDTGVIQRIGCIYTEEFQKSIFNYILKKQSSDLTTEIMICSSEFNEVFSPRKLRRFSTCHWTSKRKIYKVLHINLNIHKYEGI